MKRGVKLTLALACVGAVVFALGTPAEAGHRGHGSHGGSWGSHGGFGSHGGGFGSHGGGFGSHGGGFASHGSTGGFGSHGGGWFGGHGGSAGAYGGGFGSAGAYGGGSHGSVGGAPVYDHHGPGIGHPPYNGVGPGGVPLDARNRYNQASPNAARLVVNVPAEARVYLQDQPMTMRGPVRRFVSPDLQPGTDYIYTVRVEVQRNGRTISQTTEARVRAGQQVNVAVSFDRADPNQLVSSVTPFIGR